MLKLENPARQAGGHFPRLARPPPECPALEFALGVLQSWQQVRTSGGVERAVMESDLTPMRAMLHSSSSVQRCLLPLRTTLRTQMSRTQMLRRCCTCKARPALCPRHMRRGAALTHAPKQREDTPGGRARLQQAREVLADGEGLVEDLARVGACVHRVAQRLAALEVDVRRQSHAQPAVRVPARATRSCEAASC